MNKFKHIATGLIILGALGFAVQSYATEAHGKGCDGGRHGPRNHVAEHRGFGPDARHLGKALALTDAQKDALKVQHKAQKTEREQLRDKVVAAHESLRTAAEASADEADLNALADKLGALQARQALAQVKSQQAFVAILTPEQKQKLQELKAKRLERSKARQATSET